MAGNGNGATTNGGDAAINALRRTDEKRQDPTTAMVSSMMPQMARALPKHLDRGRFERLTLTQLRTVPGLMKCDPASLMAALMTVAQLGLEPDKAMGHVYLIPFGREVQVIVGYKGLMELARRSGLVQSITARIAHEHDEFVVNLGTDESIRHVPAIGDRGDAIAVYAVAVLDNGARVFDFMSTGDVEKVRRRSKGANSGPWKDHWDEMARKTVVRRLCKYLPMSPELAAAVDADEGVTGYDRRTGEVVMQHVDVVTVESVPHREDDAPPPDDAPQNGPPPDDAPHPVEGQPRAPISVEEAARKVAAGTKLTIGQKRRVFDRLKGLDVGTCALNDDALRAELPRAAAAWAAEGHTVEDFIDIVDEARS